MTEDDLTIHCRGLCGATHPDATAAERAGWSYLYITRSWRCGACERALIAAGSIEGHHDSGVDTLDPASRGALKREMASTILPVSVKG